MKKHILFLCSLFISLSSFSQGINFEHGTWQEVLAKAKKTDKPIFVDIYTTWCGPCKRMSKNVFPLAEVGAAYNKNFICYKIDAEKGEGIEIAKTYQVRSYPTYLFVKANGSLIMKKIGSMPSQNFIGLSATVLDELNNPKPLTDWEKEYEGKKTDTAFLLAYMNKRKNLGKTNSAIFEQYLKLIPSDDRVSDAIIDLYKSESRNLKISSIAYQNLEVNALYLYPKLGQYIPNMMSSAVDNSLREAIESKDDQLFKEVIRAHKKLPKTPNKKPQEELYMTYYKRTQKIDQYVNIASTYCDKKYMQITPDSIAKLDLATFTDFENNSKKMMAAMMDSTRFAEYTAYMAHVKRNEYSQGLNGIAWDFFENVTNKKDLEKALVWSKRSLEINPENHAGMDTYANLLYKLGRTKEAIAAEKEALDLAQAQDADFKVYEETIAKMKSGKKTW